MFKNEKLSAGVELS